MNDTLKYNTISSLRHRIVLFICMAIFFATACNKDDIPDPYVPESFSKKITRLDFIYGNDSTIYMFDANMMLTSGRDNIVVGSSGYEWFTMLYSGNGHLTGAEYNVSSSSTGHRNPYQVTYSSDKRDMLSKISFGDWKTKTFSFSYDESYRLIQLTMNDVQTMNRYTIAYDDNSNVISIEMYAKVADVEGTTKIDYSEYDANPNPFRYLVNVFYAPYFSSGNGAIFYNKIPLGMLLSKNNPGKAVKDGIITEYQYLLGEDNYPVGITGEGLSLTVKYYP